MGANAVTTVPVYVAGEVLTAADLNITNSGIPVFASTVERDAAFGGTGEKTLAEGQFAYLETGNVTQYYDGAAWQLVGGLTLISRSTSGPSATINYDGVFTSAYSAYTVILESVVGTMDSDLQCKLRVGSTTISAAYDFAGTGLTTGNAAANFANTNQSVMIFSRVSTSISRSTMTFYGVGNASEKAYFTSLSYTDEGVGKNYNVGAMCNTADTYTGFQLSAGSGNITATVAIYGLAK